MTNKRHPLQKYCKKYNLLQSDFYGKLGVTKQTWFKWLRHETCPSLYQALTIYYMTCGGISLIELLQNPQQFRSMNEGLISTTNRALGIRKQGIAIVEDAIDETELL